MKKYIVEVYNGRAVWKNEDGQFHREDGPAIEYSNGDKHWYINNKRHRTDGPAIDHKDGTKSWWVEGKRHRTDGPAVIWNDGNIEWWIEGELLSESKFNRRIKQLMWEGKVVEIDGIKYKLTKV